MNVELKEDITFDEFKAWLTGLIRGKGGALPDLDDWRKIKDMIDKVVPEKEIVNIPMPAPADPPPFGPPMWPNPIWVDPGFAPNPNPNWPLPYVGDPIPNQWEITCGGSSANLELNGTVTVTNADSITVNGELQNVTSGYVQVDPTINQGLLSAIDQMIEMSESLKKNDNTDY